MSKKQETIKKKQKRIFRNDQRIVEHKNLMGG